MNIIIVTSYVDISKIDFFITNTSRKRKKMTAHQLLSKFFNDNVISIINEYFEYKFITTDQMGYEIIGCIVLSNGDIVYSCNKIPYIYIYTANRRHIAIKLATNEYNILLIHICDNRYAVIYNNIIDIYEENRFIRKISNQFIMVHCIYPPNSNISNIVEVNGVLWISANNEFHIENDNIVRIHDSTISCMLKDSDKIYVSDWHGKLTIYSEEGKVVNVVSFIVEIPHKLYYNSMVMTKDGTICYVHNSFIYLYSNESTFKLVHHTTISYINTLHNGDIIVGGDDGVIRIYEVSNGKCVQEFQVDKNPIMYILELSCGNLLITSPYSTSLTTSNGYIKKTISGIYQMIFQVPNSINVVIADETLQITV